MFEPNRESLAWAAGLYDGEGSISYQNAERKHGRQINFEISQSGRDGVPEVLTRFRDAVGLGKIYGPYQQAASPQPVYKFRLSTFEGCQAAIAMMWPWLSGRKKSQYRSVLAGFNGVEIESKLTTAANCGLR